VPKASYMFVGIREFLCVTQGLRKTGSTARKMVGLGKTLGQRSEEETGWPCLTRRLHRSLRLESLYFVAQFAALAPGNEGKHGIGGDWNFL
jgi:hypothetical protein